MHMPAHLYIFRSLCLDFAPPINFSGIKFYYIDGLQIEVRGFTLCNKKFPEKHQMALMCDIWIGDKQIGAMMNKIIAISHIWHYKIIFILKFAT